MKQNYILPELVRLKASSQGEAGQLWMSALADTVNALEDRWQLSTGEVLSGGSESLVLTALRGGTKAVVKIGLPGVCNCANEANVYRLADGRGYPQLLEQDDEHNALLIERLGTPLGASGESEARQLEALCQTLREAWLPLDAPRGLTTGEEKARSLSTFISHTWETLERPCSERTKDLALAFALERQGAYNPQNCVLVHGDAHADNTLSAEANAGQTYKLVDPDGLFAEPEFDLAIPMRGGNETLLAGNTVELSRRRCALLASLTGTDERTIWQWGFIERVSTGLLLMKVGMKDWGLETLKVAERWSAAKIDLNRRRCL